MTERNQYYIKFKPFNIASGLKGRAIPDGGWVRIPYTVWLYLATRRNK